MSKLRHINYKLWLPVFLISVAATSNVYWGVDDDGRDPTIAGFICALTLLLTLPVDIPALYILGSLNLIGINSRVSDSVSAFFYFTVCVAFCVLYLVAFNFLRRLLKWIIRRPDPRPPLD